ncbi:hypothetical protein COO60DRAFT_989347 [Scenedesmus sp. NREL 46B-D3]|nr:hypothetical protein COO60DRAFT_989347 [Scenedesmus sp. NREL 46B-D3]
MQSKLQNCSCAGVPVANAGIIHARRRLNRRVQVHSSSSTSSSSTTTTSSSSSSSSSFSSLSSGNTVLVDGLVVQPTYRSTPWEAEHQKAQQPKDKAQVMFVSESGICRGPLAAALFRHMVAASPLRDCIEVHAKVRLLTSLSLALSLGCCSVVCVAVATTALLDWRWRCKQTPASKLFSVLCGAWSQCRAQSMLCSGPLGA